MKFQLYPLLQSAYRTGHSTEITLPKVHNDILLSMDKKRVTLLVLLDLSAALLLKRLESIALEYLGLPLAGLNHTPMEDLSAFDLTHGVPRGSCLGPLLHTIYASKLFEIVKATLRMCTPAQTILSSIYLLSRILRTIRLKPWMLCKNVLKTLGHGWQLSS